MQRFGAWRQASFRRQLLAAFLTIALVPCLLLAVIVQVNSVRERQRLIRQGQAENLQEAITTRNYLAAAARLGRNIVHDLSDEPGLITGDPARVRTRLQGLLAGLPLGQNLLITDRTGRVVQVGNGGDILAGLDLHTGWPGFPRTVSPGKITYSGTFISPLTGQPVFGLATAIRDRQGRSVGAAVAIYGFRGFRKQMAAARALNPATELYILGNDDRLTFSMRTGKALPDLVSMDRDPAVLGARGGSGTGFIDPYVSPWTGRSLIGGYAAVEPAGWLVVAATDYDLLSQPQRNFYRTAMGMLLPAGGLAILMGIWLSRRYAEPLTQLSQAVRGLREGMRVEPPHVTASAAEFTVLWESLQQTAEQLGLRDRTLAATQRTLEHMVESRTRLLAAQNRITLQLAGELDLISGLRASLPLFENLLPFDAVAFCRYNSASGSLDRLILHPADPSLLLPACMPMAQVSYTPVFDEGRAWIDADLATVPAQEAPDVTWLRTAGVRSRLILPICLGNHQVVAVLVFFSRHAGTFGESHVTQLAPVIEQIGMAAERDLLIRGIDQRRRDAESLVRMAATFSQSLRLDVVAPRILQELRTAFDADRADLWLIESDKATLVCRASEGIRADEVRNWRLEMEPDGELQRSLAQGDPVVFDHPTTLLDSGLVERFGIKSAVALPLNAEGQMLGCIILIYSEEGKRFPIERLPYAQAIAANATYAVANAGLFNRLEDTFTRLQRLQEQLIRSERMSALGQLASLVSHEIKNRFNVITTAATLADMVATAGREGAAERIRTTMATIKREVERGNDLMMRLLQFAKPKDPCRMPVALPGIIDTALITARRANVILERRIPEDLPAILGDPAALEQVFLNLLLNALQAMPHGGRLTITAMARPPWVEIAVHDTGSGMDPETLRHLFEPFFTTKAQGTGLGLVISRQIVEQHQGTILCDSKPGEGTTFTIRLPMPPQETPLASVDLSQQAGGRRETQAG